jgi:hypothetical protein
MAETAQHSQFREKLAGAFGGRSLDGINPSADQALEALSALTIADALDKHGSRVSEATENIILESQRRAEDMRKETDKIVGVMNAHRDALTRAARGSEKYAKGLMWATVALVTATVVLVYATFQLK